MKRFSEKAEKTIYAACAIATFFLAWAFITIGVLAVMAFAGVFGWFG